MRGIARIVVLPIVIVLLTVLSFYALSPRKELTDDPTKRPKSRLASLRDWELDRDKFNEDRLQSGLVKQEDKIVVIGKLSNEDTTWVETQLPDWYSAIYTVNDTSAPLHTSTNKGHESLAYLTYLVDNYDNLPGVIAFIHAHKEGWPQAWHVDSWGHSNLRILRDLNISHITEHGYANLRCTRDPGCPEWIKPHRGAEDPRGEKEMLTAWTELFGAELDVPDTLATPCCAQFAVSKEQVWKRPRENYIRWRDWILNSSLDDETIGRVWEYLWHVVFGRDAIFCPSYKTCQCQLYSRFCH